MFCTCSHGALPSPQHQTATMCRPGAAGGEASKMRIFQRFWDSAAPLLGEPGAQMWAQWWLAETEPPPPLPPEDDPGGVQIWSLSKILDDRVHYFPGPLNCSLLPVSSSIRTDAVCLVGKPSGTLRWVPVYGPDTKSTCCALAAWPLDVAQIFDCVHAAQLCWCSLGDPSAAYDSVVSQEHECCVPVNGMAVDKQILTHLSPAELIAAACSSLLAR